MTPRRRATTPRRKSGAGSDLHKHAAWREVARLGAGGAAPSPPTAFCNNGRSRRATAPYYVGGHMWRFQRRLLPLMSHRENDARDLDPLSTRPA